MTSSSQEISGTDSRVWLRVIVTAAAFGFVAYAALAQMGHAGYIAAVWPANGILLAGIMVAQRRHLSAFLGAAFVANVLADLFNGQSLYLAAYLSACSSFEMMSAVLLMRLFQPDSWIYLERPKVLAGFWGTVCLIAPGISAVLASVGLHYFVGVPLQEVFATWWIANTLGLAVVTPLLLILSRDGIKASLAAIGNRKAMVSLLVLAVFTAIVFSQTRYPLIFLVFPPMVLVAFNAGFLGVAVGLLLVTAEATILSVMGMGPLVLIGNITARESTVLVQLFLAALLLMGFPIAASLSERRKLELQLETLAATDTLTGLATRRRFAEHFQTVWAESIREQKETSILMLDIDYFKPYNDTYGHLEGDRCIRAVADIIGHAARRPFDLAVRYGGEEFLLFLPYTGIDGALSLANEIHQALAEARIPHRESPFAQITISIGIAATVPEAGVAAVTLIDAADRALYRAKRGGRSRTELAAEKSMTTNERSTA